MLRHLPRFSDLRSRRKSRVGVPVERLTSAIWPLMAWRLPRVLGHGRGRRAGTQFVE
jgi:hypothetical protein